MLRFERKDCATIMDGLVVRYELGGGYDGEISASRNGVLISGYWPVISEPASIAEVVLTIRKAELQHRHLAQRRGLWDRPDGLSEEEVEREVQEASHGR